MKYEFEEQAFRNEPMPDGLTASEAVIYTFLRNLYWSYHRGIITKEQAQAEKASTIRKFDMLDDKRRFEIKCWENSARRTLSVCHAEMMYRQKRTLENADHLIDMLNWIEKECEQMTIKKDGSYICPGCDRTFTQDQADGHPRFCDKCGCMLAWEETK